MALAGTCNPGQCLSRLWHQFGCYYSSWHHVPSSFRSTFFAYVKLIVLRDRGPFPFGQPFPPWWVVDIWKNQTKKNIIIYQVCAERKHQQKKQDGTERSCFLFSACVEIQIYPFASLPMDPGWSAANVPAGEAMRNGCGRSWWVGGAWSWLVGSPGSADDIGNSTAESWRCTLMSHRARGHAGKVSLSLSQSPWHRHMQECTHLCTSRQVDSNVRSPSVASLEQRSVLKPLFFSPLLLISSSKWSVCMFLYRWWQRSYKMC